MNWAKARASIDFPGAWRILSTSLHDTRRQLQSIPRRYPDGQGPDTNHHRQPEARDQRYEVSRPRLCGAARRVFPSGKRKSFILRFRFSGLQRKLTLGTLPDRAQRRDRACQRASTGHPAVTDGGRQLATTALRQAKSGNDPAAAKQRRKRQEQLAAESDTLQALSAEYLRREGPRLRTVRQRRQRP